MRRYSSALGITNRARLFIFLCQEVAVARPQVRGDKRSFRSDRHHPASIQIGERAGSVSGFVWYGPELPGL